ncbi:MAG: cation transporter [Patescibacteria group bacterium]|nr:cation transporter [Patescibacteria group bacterium]
MINSVHLVDIRCDGCETSIIEALEKAGARNVEIDVEKQTVSFEGDRDMMSKKLLQIGYPESSSAEAKSILKKARSYFSCAIGKTKK